MFIVTKHEELFAKTCFIEGWTDSRQAKYRYVLLECQKEIDDEDLSLNIPCYGVEIVRDTEIQASIINFLLTFKQHIPLKADNR
jgi:hypothetical protein